MEPTTATTTTAWPMLRAWLEAPRPGTPGLTRAQTYQLKRVLAAAGASSPVLRYLTRQQHRGQDAQPPSAQQWAKVLPIFAADGFGAENENSQDVNALAIQPNQKRFSTQNQTAL